MAVWRVAQERDDRPGSWHDSESPKSPASWREPVNRWVRLLSWKHKMFPFLCARVALQQPSSHPGFTDVRAELECLNEIATETYVASLVWLPLCPEKAIVSGMSGDGAALYILRAGWGGTEFIKAA